MTIRTFFTVLCTTVVLFNFMSSYAITRYGERYCNKNGFHCEKIKSGQSWRSMFPDESERIVVQKLNRMNIKLRRGMRIAIPNNLSSIDVMDISPFSSHRYDNDGEEVIIIDQNDLAWGAYGENGHLQSWGPVSPGKNYCSDVGRGCRTIVGEFEMYRKSGSGCVSGKFPLGKGGAPMPYCMFFHRGFAMHGSYDVPGYRASHGCVRLFKEDAKWLNKHFIDVRKRGESGTKVIIQPL